METILVFMVHIVNFYVVFILTADALGVDVQLVNIPLASNPMGRSKVVLLYQPILMLVVTFVT